MKKKIIICNKNFDKQKLKDLIEWFLNNYGNIRTTKLLDKLKLIGFRYSTEAGISLGLDDLKIPPIKKELIKNIDNQIKKNKIKFLLGKKNKQQWLEESIETWTITNEILKDEVIKNFRQTDLLNPVYMMIFSGARGNISQIKQLVGIRGLMSDSKGDIINFPIKTNFKEGLNSTEYFISCYGARKGLIDTALKTANSGYLTRKLIYVAQNITIKQPDCNTKTGILIKSNKKNKKQYIKTKEKIIGRTLSENIQEKNGTLIASKGQDICNFLAKKIIKNKNYIFLRSILSCRLNLGVCQLCYGWNLANNKIVKVGEAIGILAAQSIGEPGTQLTMRTFHTGGIFTGEISKFINTPHEGKIIYNENKDGKKINTKYNEKGFFLLKDKNVLIRKNNFKISKINIPKYSIIYIRPKEFVFRKQIIAEIPKWKKTKINNKNNEKEYIKSKNSGQIFFNINYKQNKKKETLWILNGNILNYRDIFKKIFSSKENNSILFSKEKKYITNNVILKIKEKNKIKKRLPKINHKSLIKIKILFKIVNKNLINYEIKKKIKKERKLLLNKINNKKSIKILKKKLKVGKFIKKNTMNKKYLGQIREKIENIIIIKKGIPYAIDKNVVINVKNNKLIEKNNTIFNLIYKKKKTKDIVEGLPKIEEILEVKETKGSKIINKNPKKRLKQQFELIKQNNNNSLANRKTIKKIQNYLIKEIQSVYLSQGVKISEKHIEIIIKQMTSKVIIKEKGHSNLLSGEILEINKIEKINQTLRKKASYEPILLGISKVCLLNESFISAACFQETTRILTRAAIMGKFDWLSGLKENLILGNLIPTGTGYRKIP
uniref:RNA polymerase subunit beta' n=1 Tax=Phacus arnoldii TaxID=298292 RepID=UPI0023AB3744|nr:RNA polymerase subunit beta' [Phacus arnoldii]WCH63547.1 RNA polymerase subunit beta' [Phacus arnoldii]